MAGSATVVFDSVDSHLVQKCMGSRSRLFGGRLHLFGNDKKLYEYTATTTSRWFSRFMLGANIIMVVVRRQYKVMKVNQLLLIGEITEEDWSKSNSEE